MGKEPLDGTSEAISSPPTDPCPRCGAETAGREACTRCGLSRAHRERFATDTALPPGLAGQWAGVLERWNDAGVHALFLESCAQAEALDLAAARYRPLSADPARAERARASLDRIVALAEAALRKQATPPDRVARTRRALVLVAALITLGFLALVTWMMLTR